MKASGNTYKQLAKRLGNEETAVVILVPSDFVFSIATNLPEGWNEDFIGSFKNSIKMSGESEYINPKTDAISITGLLTSGIEAIPGGKFAPDATELYFSLDSDPVNNESGMSFSFGHNNKSMIELEAVAKYTDKEIDFSQFTSSRSILDVLVALISGSDFEGSLTLNDDLTTAISISDCAKAIQLQREMARACQPGYHRGIHPAAERALECQDDLQGCEPGDSYEVADREVRC